MFLFTRLARAPINPDSSCRSHISSSRSSLGMCMCTTDLKAELSNGVNGLVGNVLASKALEPKHPHKNLAEVVRVCNPGTGR